MTTLEKPVFRLTRAAFAVLHHRSHRQIVVGLEPGDVLTFREKGRRQRWSLAIDDVFRFAIRARAEADRREKRALRKEGRR